MPEVEVGGSKRIGTRVQPRTLNEMTECDAGTEIPQCTFIRTFTNAVDRAATDVGASSSADPPAVPCAATTVTAKGPRFETSISYSPSPGAILVIFEDDEL